MSVAMPIADVAVSPGPPDQKETIRRQIPSRRNRDVFAAVAMGKSHSEAASEFGLTQPRVTQIVRQVREWSMQAGGGELGEYNEVQRLRLAEEILQRQFDGWMRMVMEEWRRSRREGLGRASYLTTAMRLGSNLARLSGVDVSGKTARIKAEQQAREEAELRRAREAEKPLWVEGFKSGEAVEPERENAAVTPIPATACEEQPAASPAQAIPFAPINNSSGLPETAIASDVAQTIKDRFPQATPAVSMPRSDKPIPKFLDKKVRKRLRALRRQEARAEALAAVG
ncbi:MAG: hypothetical protein ACR2FY_15590 [Pirellulaceae bacterium]